MKLTETTPQSTERTFALSVNAEELQRIEHALYEDGSRFGGDTNYRIWRDVYDALNARSISPLRGA